MNTHYRAYLSKPTSVLNLTRVYKNDSEVLIKFCAHMKRLKKEFLGDLNLFGSKIFICVLLHVECFVLHVMSSVWISDYSYNTGTELTGWSMHMVVSLVSWGASEWAQSRGVSLSELSSLVVPVELSLLWWVWCLGLEPQLVSELFDAWIHFLWPYALLGISSLIRLCPFITRFIGNQLPWILYNVSPQNPQLLQTDRSL